MAGQQELGNFAAAVSRYRCLAKSYVRDAAASGAGDRHR